MSIKLTAPQAALLHELEEDCQRGVFKSTGYGPATMLVSLGYASWARKYNNGQTGTLVITERGQSFRKGEV